MSAELRRELQRKLFHLLLLGYLAVYHWLGLRRTLILVGGAIMFEGIVEAARLLLPRLNRLLLDAFGGIYRESEARKISGVFWTSLGCWLTIFCFGRRPEAVDAALLYLALGDMAAALAGKSLGRVSIGFFGRRKTLEGSLACFLVCAASGLAVGWPLPAAAAGALAATVLELVPAPINDNLWLPLGSAFVLSYFQSGRL